MIKLIKCVFTNQVYIFTFCFFIYLKIAKFFSIYTLYTYKLLYVYIFRKVLISIINNIYIMNSPIN